MYDARSVFWNGYFRLLVEIKDMKKILAVCLLCISSDLFAYEYLTDLSGPGVTIKRYFVHKNGGLSLILNENVPKNSECNVKNHVYIKPDINGQSLMTSAALAAFASGKAIGLHGDGCETIPFWGGSSTRPIVTDLWVFE
ncbi:hypothetical protein A3757_17995 [Oleiphilus sp. HI0117]|nr:hypothetical protein A3732_18425 [Oleiphilus sp. HI0050]KZZ34322.1 hypothetical protein A3757_17995 [Oleiphilus sp. HI0117]KZZ53290.1 hypothetical protein A3761_17525 [Oleiphilus sp. HI0123]